ncbi:MAG: hypothetical protein L0332_25555 [Chloroflexi bacterium]|nr:hypothetical protein [Chloroflexota bacterium]MCI0579421.1 hypothetical protein [Chloroflexota bacterium]MCI0643364.1 hypothetical protein [Chloroflexota bacterium]MCI0730065.1 hypothetical protein [Chloroflexota bacterium]
MSERVIQASEIAEYVYCRRAWWLRRTIGAEAPQVEEMTAGTAYHRAHGAAVDRANVVQQTALVLVFLAVGILVFWLIQVL